MLRRNVDQELQGVRSHVSFAVNEIKRLAPLPYAMIHHLDNNGA